MKNCTFEKYLLPFLTHELAAEDYDKVSRHAAECAHCAAILAEMQDVEKLLHAYRREKVPPALYKDYTRALHHRFGRAPLRRRLPAGIRAFTAGLVRSASPGYRLARSFAILLLGIMIGRFFMMQPGALPPTAAQSEQHMPALTSADVQQLNDYFIQAEQLLLTIANTPETGIADDELVLNKNIAKNLLVKSRSVQRKAGVLDDESITVFLNHLEFILLEMSNREDDKIHSAFQDVREMVKEADLVKKSMQLQEKMARSLATSA